MGQLRRLTFLCGLLVCTLLTGRVSGLPRGPITVLQVEAPDVYGRFAPVDFGRLREVVADGPLAGLRVVADSVTSTDGRDEGWHARRVAETLAGTDAVGGLSVSSLRVMNSNDFLTRVLRPTQRSGRAGPPARLPGRPAVVNASFSGSSGWDGMDHELIRRADQVVWRDGTIMVAGAVTSASGPFAGATLVWGARNAIAVRGAAQESVFEPHVRLPGRRYADVWDDETASLATARVSSTAARLIEAARGGGRVRLTRPAAVRAALLASADRRAGEASGAVTWSPQTANGLHAGWGAGRLDASGASDLFAQPVTQPVPLLTLGTRGDAVGSPVGSSGGGRTGWLRPAGVGRDRGLALLQVRPQARATAGGWAVPFRLERPAGELAASLAWEVNPLRGPAGLGALRLELFGLTLTPAGTMTLSGPPLRWITTAGENVALLTLEAVPAGDYAWVVYNESRVAVSPVLAWSSRPPLSQPPDPTLATVPPSAGSPLLADPPPPGSPTAGTAVVPEPGGYFAAWLVGAAVLLPRRSRPSI